MCVSEAHKSEQQKIKNVFKHHPRSLSSPPRLHLRPTERNFPFSSLSSVRYFFFSSLTTLQKSPPQESPQYDFSFLPRPPALTLVVLLRFFLFFPRELFRTAFRVLFRDDKSSRVFPFKISLLIFFSSSTFLSFSLSPPAFFPLKMMIKKLAQGYEIY